MKWYYNFFFLYELFWSHATKKFKLSNPSALYMKYVFYYLAVKVFLITICKIILHHVFSRLALNFSFEGFAKEPQEETSTCWDILCLFDSVFFSSFSLVIFVSAKLSLWLSSIFFSQTKVSIKKYLISFCPLTLQIIVAQVGRAYTGMFPILSRLLYARRVVFTFFFPFCIYCWDHLSSPSSWHSICFSKLLPR